MKSNIKYKVAILCECPSPFISDFARVLSSNNLISAEVVFTLDLSAFKTRYSHWSTTATLSYDDFQEQIDQFDYVLSGLPISSLEYLQLHRKISKVSRLIYTNERPCPVRFSLRLFKNILYFFIFRYTRPLCILGFGENAARFYSKFSPSNTLVAPYVYHIENNSSPSSVAELSLFYNRPYKFIFSGQLIERNSLFHLLKAFSLFKRSYDVPLSNLEIYGDGILLNELIAYSSSLGLKDSVSFNTTKPSD